MKKICLLILMCSILSWNNSFGQEFKYKRGIKKHVFKDNEGKLRKEISFDQVKRSKKDGWFVRTGTEWGLINLEGAFILQLGYEEIKDLKKDQILVKKNGLFGLFQNDGVKILDIEYEGIDSFKEGKAVIKQNGSWGILENGKFSKGTGDYIFKNPDKQAILKVCQDQGEDCSSREILEIIFQNIIYPKEAVEKKVEGTVVLDLEIGETGKLLNVTAVRKIGAGCEEEGIRIVKKYMTDWVAGKHGDEFVKTQKYLPIKYKLK